MVAPQIDIVRENGGYVEALRSSVLHGSSGLDDMPNLVIEVITNNRWQRFYNRAMHKELEFSSFKEFAESQNGLSSSVEMLKRMCSDNPQAMDALDKAIQGKQGGDRGNQYTGGKIDNVQHATEAKSPTGNSSDAAIRRLRNHAIDRETGEVIDPKIHDLYERVLSGEISPNKAAIEAGFRKRTFSIPADDAAQAARYIRRNMNAEKVNELIRRLQGAR